MKVLFLQSREYFEELGVDLSNCDADFTLFVSFNLRSKLKRYDLIVSCIEHDLGARRVVNFGNSLGIPTVFLMDGVFDLSNSVSNPLLKRLKVVQFKPFIYSNIFLLGDRFANYINNKELDVKVFSYLPKRAALVLQPREKVADVLITTAITPYFDENEKIKLTRWITFLATTLEKHNISIKLRVFDETLLENEYLQKINNTKESLSDAVSSVSCVMCTPSTVIHSLSVYGFPNILLNFRSDEIFYESGYELSALNNVKNAIDYIVNSLSCKANLNKKVDYGVNLDSFEYNKSHYRAKIPYLYFSFSTLIRLLYKKLPNNIKKILKKSF